MTDPATRVRILVCGSAERGDDGAALGAVARLLPTLPPEVCDRLVVRRCIQLDEADLADLGPDEACVVVDTLVGVPAGSLVARSLDDLLMGGAPVSSRSTHGIALGDAVARAATIRGAAPAGAFVGLGGKWFGYGGRMSRAVRSALPAFAEAIEHEVERLLDMAT